MGAGLGTSGAISAAMAFALRTLCYPDQTNEINPWGHELNTRSEVNNHRFLSVFHDACEFDQLIQGGRTSGVRPFASLVGSEQMAPFLYQKSPISDDASAGEAEDC